MSELPPPIGRPLGEGSGEKDPWFEQARRRAEHQSEERRRRLRWLVPLVVVAVVVAIALLAIALWPGDSAEPPPADEMPPPATDDAPSPIVADSLVTVEEVWLVDRGDGVFDWGVVVVAPPLAPTRSGVEIEVRLVDADGDVVDTVVRAIDGVDTDSPGAAIGQVVDPVSAPVRIEYDVAVGVESNDPAFDEFLDVRALVRSGDEVSGLVRSSSTDPVRGLSAVFVWRDEDAGDVIGMAIQPIDEIRPGVDARFVLDVAGENLPDSRPDDVFWVPGN